MNKHVTVLPRPQISAWYGEGNKPGTWPKVPLLEALENEYMGEACLVMYTGDVELPRLGKSAVGHFIVSDDVAVLEVIAVDIDYPNKQTPPEGWVDEILGELHEDFRERAGWYRTPHGMRLLFIPREPVPVPFAQNYLDRLHDRIGVATDLQTKDWTRLFKLPRSLRRDLPRDYSGLRPLEWHPEDLDYTDASSLGEIVVRDRPSVSLDKLKITREDVRPLPKSLADDLYRDTLVAETGDRHATLLSAAMTIVNAYRTKDPLKPYRLLLKSALEMGKSAEELWRICEWACALWSGRQSDIQREVRAVTNETAGAMGITTEKVRSRIIVDCGAEFFVWDELRKEYSSGYTNARQLPGALVRHCPRLSQGVAYTKASTPDIMRDYSVVANEVVQTYDPSQSGFNEDNLKFYIPRCKVDPSIFAKYDAEVHEYAKLITMGLPQGMNYLAAYPDITRPLCAWYLDGPPSIGKSMWAMGLARMHSLESTYTPYKELVSSFNSSLLRSPLIWADESVPSDIHKANDSSVFRQAIGNGTFTINEKYRAAATLSGYPRILITANNAEALDIREDLDQDDIAAIRLRVGYIKVDGSPGDYLRDLAKKRKYESVREMTEEWVRGGRIARHIMWLHENHEYEKGDRLLVEGWESEFTEALSTSVGSSQKIMSTIVGAILKNRRDIKDALQWDENGVHVNSAGMEANWSDLKGFLTRSPSEYALKKALKSISKGKRRRISVNGSQLWFWTIDIDTICRTSDQFGIAPAEEVRNKIKTVKVKKAIQAVDILGES